MRKDVVRSGMAAAVLLLAGCHDSGSPTGPAPISDIRGAWIGTFSNDNIEFDCLISGLPAQASFEQDGTSVRGTVSTANDPCGLGTQTFVGTLSGDQLLGKTQVGGGEAFGEVRGTLSGSTLEMGFGFAPQGGYPSFGRMHLHR
ncbi:MAG TPA: hypothetical protein VKG01_06050 [Thermoanaerobaculia bacterium]|nr:hypothetical protein [Thermoanaerobaculia bacterium]